MQPEIFAGISASALFTPDVQCLHNVKYFSLLQIWMYLLRGTIRHNFFQAYFFLVSCTIKPTSYENSRNRKQTCCFMPRRKV